MSLDNFKDKLITCSFLAVTLIVGTSINMQPASAQTLIAISADGELDEYKPHTAPTLRLGNVSKHVAEVQILLQELGFYNGRISSIYNPQMLSSVKDFQRSRNLTANGIISVQTWNALINASSQVDVVN